MNFYILYLAGLIRTHDSQCKKAHYSWRTILVPNISTEAAKTIGRKTTPMSGAREERKRVNRTGSELASRGLKGAISRGGGKSFAATFVMHAG